MLRPGDLAFAVERASIAGHARLTILRGGKTPDLPLSLAARDQAQGLKLRQASATMPEAVTSCRLAALGVVLDGSGMVTTVSDNSPALHAGLGRGDRILTVNGAAVDLADDEITAQVLILVQAPSEATRHSRLDPWGSHDGMRPVGGANVLDPAVAVF